MALDISTESLIDAHGVKSSRVASYVGRSRLQLLSRLMTDRKASVVVGNILITIIAALSKSFLEAVAFVNEHGFIVAGAMHGSVGSQLLNLNKLILKETLFFTHLQSSRFN